MKMSVENENNVNLNGHKNKLFLLKYDPKTFAFEVRFTHVMTNSQNISVHTIYHAITTHLCYMLLFIF